MAKKKGLGLSKESIFKKTTSAKTQTSVKAKPSVSDEWVKVTLQFRPEHKEKIAEMAFMQKKEKREVLAEIIQGYLEKN